MTMTMPMTMTMTMTRLTRSRVSLLMLDHHHHLVAAEACAGLALPRTPPRQSRRPPSPSLPVHRTLVARPLLLLPRPANVCNIRRGVQVTWRYSEIPRERDRARLQRGLPSPAGKAALRGALRGLLGLSLGSPPLLLSSSYEEARRDMTDITQKMDTDGGGRVASASARVLALLLLTY